MNEATSQSKLKGELSARQIFSLGFGTIIGVGWVIVLGEWLGQAGPIGAALSFLAGGLLITMVGLCYAEMASLIPASGGEVAYSYAVFGTRPSFAVGWFLLLVYVAACTFEAVSMGWVISALVPGSEGPALYSILGSPIHLWSLVLGLLVQILLTLLNYRGARDSARFQEILTLILLLATGVFVSAGIGWGRVAHLEPFFQEDASGSVLAGMLAVFVTAPFWFGGFNVIPQVMEERASGTSSSLAARTIVLSVAVATAFYVLVILSAAMTTSWRDLLELDLPAAGAFQIAFDSPVMAKVVLGVALLGLITTWNAVFIAGSRVVFSLGRARMIPAFFSRVHPQHGTPSTAVLFIGVVGAVGIFLGRSAIIPIVNVGAIGLSVAYLFTCLGVVKLRRMRPGQKSPYSVPGGAATALVAAAACLVLLGIAFVQPYTGGESVFPLEWIYLVLWSGLGLFLWVAARDIRNSITEEERRNLILGGAIESDEESS